MAPRPGLTRERVVEAAAGLIDRADQSALSLTELARTLGVRPPSLYNHIDGLEDLRGALRLTGLRQLEQRIQRAAVGRARRDALVAIAGAYRSFAREHPGLYALTASARGGAADGARDTDASEQAAARLVEVVLSVLRGYELEGDDALHAVRALRSSLHGFVSLESAGAFELPLDLDTSFERLIDLHDAGLQRAAP